jgi:hypothetical protein
MKHDELWNDLIHDAQPPGAATAALAAMCRESRRLRARLRIIRAGGTALLLAAASTAVLRYTSPDQPQAFTSVPAQQTVPVKLQTHPLTDTELVSRLHEAGYGIAIAGQKGERRLLIVSHTGTVYP